MSDFVDAEFRTVSKFKVGDWVAVNRDSIPMNLLGRLGKIEEIHPHLVVRLLNNHLNERVTRLSSYQSEWKEELFDLVEVVVTDGEGMPTEGQVLEGTHRDACPVHGEAYWVEAYCADSNCYRETHPDRKHDAISQCWCGEFHTPTEAQRLSGTAAEPPEMPPPAPPPPERCQRCPHPPHPDVDFCRYPKAGSPPPQDPQFAGYTACGCRG